MNCKRRLLILSCSQRKNTAHGFLPALERYDGPLFFVLRRFLRECPQKVKQLDIYILSAAYGLIPTDFQIEFYDQKMDLSRVVELQPQIKSIFSDILRQNYASICFVLGKIYLKAFEDLHNLIPTYTESIVAYGPIGKKTVTIEKMVMEISPMIVEIFKCANDETPIEIKIEYIDVSRVLPFNTYVGERISIGKLKLLLNKLDFTEDINIDEPEIYFAQQVSVWLDDDTVLGYRTPFDIPHHIALQVVLESVLQKNETNVNMQIRIN